MNKIPTAPKAITLDKNQLPGQDKIIEIHNFQKGVQPNERINVTESGTTITFTRDVESGSKKLSRKLHNFESNVKSAFDLVRDSLWKKNKAGTSDKSTSETSNIKNHQLFKPNSANKISISLKKFIEKTEPLTKNIPLLKDLQTEKAKSALKNLPGQIGNVKTSFIPLLVSSNEKELTAFLKFAKAQVDGSTLNDANDKNLAINFAKQWTTKIKDGDTKAELLFYLNNEALSAISLAAQALVNFDSAL
jgi:hypothetical protein